MEEKVSVDETRLLRLKEFRDTPVWKQDIEPRLIDILTSLEAAFCSTKDVHKRYALVEAYVYMKDLKLWLDGK